jgi:hypothetical protein
LGVQIPPGAPDFQINTVSFLNRNPRTRCGKAPAVLVLIGLGAASCTPALTAAQSAEAQQKFAEYQLAAAVVSRTQTCFETIMPELRAMIDGGESGLTEQQFAAKWGLERFDPNTGFNDAWAACVGKPGLKELGIRDNETPLSFLDRKRDEWNQAAQPGAVEAPSRKNAPKR